MADKEKKELPNVPTYNMGKMLFAFHAGVGMENASQAVTQITPANYSVLNPDNIYQSTEDVFLIALNWKESKQQDAPIPKLVSFKPLRVLLHEVAAYVTAFLRIDEEKQRQERILEIVKSIDVKSLETLHEIIKAEVAQMIAQKQQESNPIISQALKDANKLSTKHPELKININELAINIASSQLYNEHIGYKVNLLVNTFFDEHILNEQKKIPSTQKETLTMFCAGGQASGKGTSIGSLLAYASQRNVDPRDIVIINTDSYKQLVMQGVSVDPLVFSQCAHPESGLIRDRVVELSRKFNMHTMYDQVFVGKDVLDDGVSRGDVVGCVVSTEVKTALQRSFNRGKEMGRFEDTNGILRCHKLSTEQCIDRIIEQLDKNVQITFVDNNVEKGMAPIPFMQIDCSKRTIKIFDENLLSEFLKKILINAESKTFDSVYPQDIDSRVGVAVEDFKKKLREAGLTITEAPKHLLKI